MHRLLPRFRKRTGAADADDDQRDGYVSRATDVFVAMGAAAAVGRDGHALATVSGIIDGTGALGAAAAQYVVALLSGAEGDGWRATFVFLVVCVCLSLLILLFSNFFLFIIFVLACHFVFSGFPFFQSFLI